MDRLEAVELKLSEVFIENKSFRFDSEYFKTEYLELQKEIYKYPHKQLGEFAKITDGEHGSVIFEKSGVKYLGAENIKKGFIDISNIKYVNKIVDERNKRASVEINDILISIKGTLGEVAIAEPWLLPANMSRDVAIIKNYTKNEFIDDYIVMFLMSKIGNTLSERLGSGGVQQMITLERLRTIIIPKPSIDFQNKVSEIYKKSRNNLSSSKILYKQSEQLLLKELDLLDFTPSKENIAIKSFSESFGNCGRLDSEHYLLKYDEIEKNINKNSNATFVKDEFLHIKTKFDKSKDGYNYIEIGNVNVSDGTNISNYALTKDLPANAKINALDGDLLISTVRPNRGAITIINTDETDLIVSGAFTVLRKKENSKISTQVLQVLLRTNVYKELLLKYNVGTQYPVIKDEDVLNLMIPIIDNKVQIQIENKIKESFNLKEESQQLLEVAKQAVEIAIEKDEEVALKYIEESKYE